MTKQQIPIVNFQSGDGSSMFSFNAQNYTDLTANAPTPETFDLAYVRESEGTAWLPGSLGGTYYPKGVYMWDGLNWVSDRDAIAARLSQVDTGWADYTDTQYTTSSPFTILDGQKLALPNNAGSGVTSQISTDTVEFYDSATQTITGRNGDGMVITVEFKVRPTGPAASPRIKMTVDIGGAVGELYPRDFVMSKGNGSEHFFLSSFGFYTLNTWEANGGTVLIEAIGEDVEIYDIRYVIQRTHKAR